MDTSSPTPTKPPESTPAPPVDMASLESKLAVERARVEAEFAQSRIGNKNLSAKKIITIIAIVVAVLTLLAVLFPLLTNMILPSSSSSSK